MGASQGQARGGQKKPAPPEEALYDQPVAALERTPGDDSRTCHHKPSSPVVVSGLSSANAQYSTLDQTKNPIYHTLEPDRPPCGIIPSLTSPQTPFIPDMQIPPQPSTTPLPIYQEISELSTSRGGSTNRSITCTANGGGISNTPLSSSSPPHVQRSLSVPTTDHGVTDTPNQWVKTNIISVKRGTMV